MARKQKGTVDPSQTIEISASRSQTLGFLTLTVLAGLGVAAAVWLNANILTTTALIGFLAGTAALVALSVLLAKLMFRTSAPVLTLSPDGVCDRRLSPDTVSWRDVEELRPRRNRQVPVIELVLTKEAEQALTYKPLTRVMRNYQRLSKAMKYNVSAHGLQIRHPQLLATFEAYFEAYGAPGKGDASPSPG